jgi:hypothetical protein
MTDEEYNRWLINPSSLKTMFHRELTPVLQKKFWKTNKKHNNNELK